MNFLIRTGDRLRHLSGWRRLAVAFAMGALSALAFAPLEIFPLLLLGYAALVPLLDSADAGPHRIRRAASTGWWFGFGQYLVGLHWIAFPFLVDPANHLWQMPFAVAALPAGLAIFPALACLLAMVFWQDGPARIFALAVMLAAFEWVRGHIFTGFPWNLPAYGWGASLALLQSASLMGSYGLSFLTILFGLSLAELMQVRWRMSAAMVCVFAALLAYGVYHLATTPQTAVPGVVVRLVQPNIPQKEMFVRRLMLRNWRRLIALSVRPADKALGAPTHIVWPEAATGFAVARSSGALDQISLFTMRGQTLLTGSVRVDMNAQGERAWYNSLYVFGSNGAAPQVYDKFHLVPFGEYVPYAEILARVGITQVTTGEGASAGDHPHVLQVAGAPAVTPLICYEVIFPHEVTDPAEPRPGWFVNVTDDAWFGPWAGPRQHFLTARVRAIEEGLPIARAANTGISAMIDAQGRVVKSLPLNQTGVVDAALPVAAPATVYARFGDLIFLLFLVTGGASAFLLARKPGGRAARSK
jgi:apolipoprotein N-acyltransferase